MAYFQIDKNPKRKFFDSKTDRTKLTSEDYKEAAEALMRNAEEYYLFIIKASKSDLSQVLKDEIEGSTLTEEQTASLFDNGTLPKSDDYYRAKDVEEMNGHFLMFNKMIDTLDEPLTRELIKQFHYELKSGVFEARANGYAIGDYKQRPNMIGMYQTVRPENVAQEMHFLMDCL